MARYGGDVVNYKVTTTSATAAYRDISQQVLEFSGIDLEAILEQGHTFGDAWEESAYTGMRKINEITMTTFWDDDTSTGVQGMFGNASDIGAERNIKINLGTTNAYPKFDFIIRRVSKKPQVGALTKCDIVIVPTGALTIVTT